MVTNSREKQRECDRRHYRKHKAELNAKRSQRRRRNPEWEKQYRETNREKLRATSRRYSAKKDGYAECVDYPPPPTDSKCSICHREAVLVLDHNHETGKFRGYICRECNMGLGKLGDTLASIRRALAYLERTDV